MGSTKRIGLNWRARWHFSIGLQIEAYCKRMLVAEFGPSKVAMLLEIQKQSAQMQNIMFEHMRLASLLSEAERRRIQEAR